MSLMHRVREVITGPHKNPIRQAEERVAAGLEEESDMPRISGILERCSGCNLRRRPGTDPLWPLVPLLKKPMGIRRDGGPVERCVMLEGFCPTCAGKLLAFMLAAEWPWVEHGVQTNLILGVMS